LRPKLDLGVYNLIFTIKLSDSFDDVHKPSLHVCRRAPDPLQCPQDATPTEANVMTRRNDKCPCNSGKKYKACCWAKDQESSLHDDTQASQENTPHKYPTWKIVALLLTVLGALSLVLLALGFPRAAGALFGCGMLCLIIYATFRESPPSRKNPGNGGSIDFGKR